MNMKLLSKTTARAIPVLVAVTFVWSAAGGWLPSGLSQQHASAAALTVEHVTVTPSQAPGSSPKAPLGAARSQAPYTLAGTGFTYQGRLMDNSVPANGQYDLRFTLYDALTGGNQAANPITVSNQTVTNGLFTSSLDFGPNAFYGDARWVELGVKAAGASTFTTLAPRQPLSAATSAFGTRWEGASNKPYPYNPLRQPNTVSTVDLSPNVGYYTSIAVGADGMALISHQDANNRNLRVTHCSNLECSSATSSVVDPSVYMGNYTSLAIGADGLGLISYYDYFNRDLKVAHCSNVLCSSATTTTIDSTGDVGDASALTIGGDGLGLIVYDDYTNRALKVAHCSNIACTSVTTSSIDTQGSLYYTSITTGVDGLGLIAYMDGSGDSLKVAHCSNTLCSSATSTIFNAPYYAMYISVAVGSDGLGLISYYGTGDGFQRLKVLHCSNIACNSGTLSILDSSVGVNYQTSVTIGPDGLGVISYMDYTHADLRVAHCSNITCSSATLTTVDSQNFVGDQSSIAIGVDGLPIISYHDDTTANLKVAHCGSPSCVPYQHKR